MPQVVLLSLCLTTPNRKVRIVDKKGSRQEAVDTLPYLFFIGLLFSKEN